MYILDTNVISELRKGAKADANVLAWASSVEASTLYISPISIMEIEMGILRLDRDQAQQDILRTWFERHVLVAFAERILAIDVHVVRACAKLHVPKLKSERDALITATGIVHQMTIVTRNTADFAGTGVALLNPWHSTLK